MRYAVVLWLLSGACSAPASVGGGPADGGAPIAPGADAGAPDAGEPPDPADCTVPSVPSDGAVKLETDLVYTIPWEGQSYAAPQALDIAWPAAGPARALVLVIHGGGWHGGDKADHRDDILLLAGQGYAAASVNYRLVKGWENVFPAAVTDVRCAVRWARAQVGRFGIAAGTPVIAIGASAGAHLASLLGTAPEVSGLEDGQCTLTGSPAVDGTVSYYGRMDLARAPVPSYLRDFLGASPEDEPARAALASPVTHVDASDRPMLLLHGAKDDVVPIDHLRLMRDALAEKGVPARAIELADQGHAFPLFGQSGSLRQASCATLAFLRETRAP